MALPFINLYIGDVMKDCNALSPCAFGAYMRLLFKMHSATPRGEVAYTLPQLCRVFGAATIQETENILSELTDASNDIINCTPGEKYILTNRRMIRETAISQARSASGKKGAEKTNAKNRQNEKVAEEFAAANDITNSQQNYNSINSNNSNEDDGVIGEEETETEPKAEMQFAVPEMWIIWKRHRPKYIAKQQIDFPALRKMAECIGDQENVSIQDKPGIERIKEIWEAIVLFTLTHSLYKDFQLDQIEKYFQAITSAFASANDVKTVPVTENKKQSVIANNINAAQQARNILSKKYQTAEA